MSKKPDVNDLELFFNKIKIISPIEIILKLIITFGIYIIIWFYKMNLILEQMDEDAPDSRRGIIVLYFLPPFIYLFSKILTSLIKIPEILISIYNIFFWSFVIFLSLKYIYDFCSTFGKWTGSNGLIWYIFIYPGYFSIILYFFDFYYTLPLLFFTIISIPSMQAFMNIKERKFREMYEHERFNRKAPAQSGR